MTQRKKQIIPSLFTYHSVVDIGGPHAREEKQAHVREVVNRQHEQADHVRRRLQKVTMIMKSGIICYVCSNYILCSLHLKKPVNGVEGDGGPGREREGLVVLVVQAVDVLVQKLVLVERAVDPVDAHLHEQQVERLVGDVPGPATHLVNVEVHLGHVVLDDVLGQDGQTRVHKERSLGQAHLVKEGAPGRERATLAGEELLHEDVVDHDVPDAGDAPVYGGSSHEIADVALHVVTSLGTELRQRPLGNVGKPEKSKEQVVDELVRLSVGIQRTLGFQSDVSGNVACPERQVGTGEGVSKGEGTKDSGARH